MKNKDEIIQQLKANVIDLMQWVEGQEDERFTWSPAPGKWSTGQHLDHLIRSTRPLNLAYRLPYWSLRMQFGHKNDRPERSYEQLVDRYKERLAQGGQATGPYVPPVVSVDQKMQLLKQFKRENERLIKAIKSHSEDKLGIYLLPHPLLGKLTLREMLYFAVHHVKHHYQLLLEHYEV